MDYRAMFDRDYLGAWDLLGKDISVTISKVEAKKLKSQHGENLKPIIWFEGKEKGLVCNKTNAKTIAGIYGPDTTKWIGKRIAMYPTTTHSPDGDVECIRIRPTAPAPVKGGS